MARAIWASGGAAVVVVAGLVWAATPPDKGKPATSEPTSLAGPRIGAKHDEKTLVHRDFDGRLKRLEAHPVNAALDLMDLSAEERAAAAKPLMERSLAIEKIMRDNTRLVLEAQAAFKPGDDGNGQRAVMKLYELAQPVFAKGKLVDLAAAELNAEKAGELRRLVGEYMQAAVADRMAGHADGQKQEKLGAFLGESIALFGMEVEAAAKRTFEGGEKDFHELSRKLDLTLEQESKMQAIFVDMMAKGYHQPNKREQMLAMLNAYSLLTDDQRAKLREMMAQEARDAAKAKQQMRQSGKGGK